MVFAVVAGLLAALPSLLWAASGPGLIVDDWTHAAESHDRGVWGHFWATAFTGNPRRPGAGAWYATTFGVFGQHPVGHALALAALNFVTGALVFLVARRLWGTRPAIFTALAWAALPNRGASRLWFAAAPSLLAVALLLGGVLLLLHRQPGWATALLTCAVLTYEAVVGLCVCALLVWAWRSGVSRRRALLLLIPILAAALYLWARSPKRGSLHPFTSIGELLAAHLGRGLFRSPPVAVVAGVLVLGVVGVVAIRAVLGRSRTAAERMVLHGAGIFLAGAAPLVLIGFPFATDGIFDRGNVATDLGTAVVLGAIVTLLASRAAIVGTVAGLTGLALLGAQNGHDIADYRRAVRDGDRLLAHVDIDLPVIDGPLLIGPPLPARGGVAQLLTDYDTSDALRLRRHDRQIVARMACSTRDFETAVAEPLRYDRLARTLERRPAGPPDGVVFGLHC